MIKKLSAILPIVLTFFVLGLKSQVVTQTLSYTGGIQTFSVPQLCVNTITIEARGAGGGSTNIGCISNGGLGASMKGEFVVTTGQTLLVLVGQVGQTNGSDGGGGGGSFVTNSSSVALIIAGGGGGATNDVNRCGTAINPNRHGINASITTTGTPSANGLALGGVNGNGGAGAGGGAGGGFTTDGTPSPGAGGKAFLNGAAGGQNGSGAFGGYGGGGGGFGTGGNGGGGGGYSGGGTSINTQPYTGGGGGGSYNTGSNQNNTAGVQAGNGVVYISYNPGTPASASVSNSNICVGGSATLTGVNLVTYTWSPGGSNANSITVTPTVTTIYTLQGTSTTGCPSTGTMAIIVFTAVPTLTVVNTASVLCLGKTVILTASGATTYTWTNSITNGSPYLPASTATYVVTGQNACGTNTAATSVTVNPLPNITASINNPTVCSGNTIILNGGNSVSGYTWNPSVTNNSAFVPASTTNYTVTGAGANGCTNTAVTGVTVLITPTITPVVTPTAICLGATATLTAVGATGYTWIPGSNPNTSTIQVSPPGPTTYTVLRTNGACSSSSTVNLIVNPLPLVNASATPSQICMGTGVNLVVVGPITNTWLPGGFTASNFTLYPNFSQNYTVTGSNGNCTATAVVPVVVNPTPTLSISSSTTTICQGNSIIMTGGGAQTYTWMPSGGTNITEVISPPSTTIITLSGTNSFSCTTSKTQLIIVNALPNMSLTSSLPYICAGNTAVLSIASSSANVVYNWSTGPVGNSISVSPVVTTNYFATGTNTLTGCVNTNTITLAVYISTFTAISGTAICKGETVTLTASGAAPNYSWTGSIMSSSIAVSPLVNTTYYVTGLNVSCSNTQAITVTVNPLPNVTASVAKGQICKFEIATITGNGASTYSWNTGVTTQVLTFTLGITTTYTLTGTDNNGCSKTTTVTQFVATCIGLDEAQAAGQPVLNVYPNPNNGNFVIRADAAMTLLVINTLGQVIDTIKLSENNKNEVTVSNLPTGIYFITGETNGRKVTGKIVVER